MDVDVFGAVDLRLLVLSPGVGDDVQIMVGGNGFNGARELWKEVGADGYAETADEALRIAEQLVADAGI